MRLLACSIATCILFALPATSRASGELGNACGAPDEFISTDVSLDQLHAAIAAGSPVDMLAVGSATTVGSMPSAGAQTTAEAAFPWQMAHALHTALPKVEFRVTVRGGRGMTAEEMLGLLDTALKQQHYQLVLWQTGTVEAVRGLRPDGMLDVLHSGAEKIRDAGGDLVLIDPQFSRFLRANADLDPYEQVMQQVATMPGVVLFRRFDLMRTWATNGGIDLERTPKPDRDKALADLNVCLGEALARLVLSGTDLGKK